MLPRVEERESGLASPLLGAWLRSLWLELNSTPGAIECRDRDLDERSLGRALFRAVLEAGLGVAALQRAAEISLA